jgi:hypothetical protein
MSIKELTKLVGKPYQALDENGYYFGCFEPAYFLYPKVSRFKLPQDKSEYFDFALSKIKFFTDEVDAKDIQRGDLIVLEYPGRLLHLGVYLGDFKMAHTFRNTSMKISRIDFDNKRIIGVYRLKEVYREEI